MADTISRQMAIDALGYCQTYLFDSFDKDKKISLEDAEYAIEQLPSAERKGHWLEEDDGIIHGRCSNCGWVAVWQSTDVFGMDYCPHCGARMEVET